ncbi:MAG: hypothetical protein LBT46_01365 [Planctomycetaceae bacterium]|jgi:cell division protein FtsL|nr:hypothetical protein [Planctomycetaceae bacterium]
MASKRKKKVNNSQTALQIKSFALYHGEKAGLAIFAVIALWVAFSSSYTGLPWGPDELDKEVQKANEKITSSKYTAADAGLIVIDYAKLSEQIKEPIPAEPYQTATLWQPSLLKQTELREDVAILPPEFAFDLKVERGTPDAEGNTMLINISLINPIEKQREIYETAFKKKPKGMNGKNEPVYVDIIVERAEIGTDTTSPDWIRINEPDKIPAAPGAGRGQTGIRQPFAGMSVTPEYKYPDAEIEAEKTYAYRARLVADNPNYGLSPDQVVEGVDIKSLRKTSDWSAVKTVFVPSQTSVQIAKDTKIKPLKWMTYAPFNAPKGIVNIVKFDDESGKDLPPLPVEVMRGSVCNLSKKDITSVLKAQEKEKDTAGNRPSSGNGRQQGDLTKEYLGKDEEALKSGICVADILPEYELPKVNSKDSRTTPDVTLASKMLFIMPNGMMRVQVPERDQPPQGGMSGRSPSSREDYGPPGRGDRFRNYDDEK